MFRLNTLKRYPKNSFKNLFQAYCFASTPNRIGLIGVPFDKGQSKVGVANGPKSIRDAGLLTQLQNIHEQIDVKDYGDVSYSVDEESQVPNMKKYSDMAACNYQVSKHVKQVIQDGRMCITIGGDHCIGIGTVDGHVKAKHSSEDICVLWVDAHADLNTNKTSTSGHTHGMPLALLATELADYWPYLPGMDWQQPVMSIRNVAYIGLRSVDRYERLMIEKLGIAAFGIDDVEEYGIGAVVNMAMKRIDGEQNRSIHLSFDIDSLDSIEAPSTGTPERGGLTLREGLHIVETVYKTNRLTAMDLVEVNPAIGSAEDVQRTVEAAILLIKAACGYNRRGLRSHESDSMELQTFPPTRQPL